MNDTTTEVGECPSASSYLDRAYAGRSHPLHTFLMPILILLLVVKLVHGRRSWTVAFPSWPARWRDYSLGIGVGWSVMIVMLFGVAMAVPGFEITYRGFDDLPHGGALLMPFLIVSYVIQTGFEEHFFGGLMMRATRRVTRLLHRSPVCAWTMEWTLSSYGSPRALRGTRSTPAAPGSPARERRPVAVPVASAEPRGRSAGGSWQPRSAPAVSG